MRATTYQRGDVLFAEIQFSGSIGWKNRPVIVLSTDAFHQAGSKLIVAGVTSTIKPPHRPGDVLLNDWGRAGLIKPSAFRGLVTVIDRIEIIRYLGRLSSEDFAQIEQGVASIMGLAVSAENSKGEQDNADYQRPY